MLNYLITSKVEKLIEKWKEDNSEQELRRKGKILDKLLKKIDTEVQINQRLYKDL